MRITLLGHASLLVEADGCTALFDPVLFDPHQEGVLHVAPPRQVLLERLPRLDAIVVSHRHLDHFDVRSLAHLPRDLEVIIPAGDDLLSSALARLGYGRVRRLADFEQTEIGATRLLATRSENRVPELGIVVADRSGVCWNEVDTVLSAETIDQVAARCGPIDLLFAAWQPLIENDYQSNRSIAFPMKKYAKMLDDVKRIAPRFVVPGSCGFAYAGPAAWMNHIVFPVTRARFAADLETLAPTLRGRILPLDPGDALTIENGEVRRDAASPFVVRLAEGPLPGDFRPAEAGAPLRDDEAGARPPAMVRAIVERELTVDLPAFIAANPEQFQLHRQWRVLHQVEVVFPDDRRRWHFDFAEQEVTARAAPDERANLFSFITASGLCDLVEGVRGWDRLFLTGAYRTHRKLYRIDGDAVSDDGAKAIRDPLRIRYPFDAALWRVVERELAKVT